MRGVFRLDGTGNASPARVTEWVLTGAAAIETILVAALALLFVGPVGGDGGAPGVAGTVERLNALLLFPLRAVLPGVSPMARQVGAVAVYGALSLVLAGVTSWVERRRAFV
jgi:hypothetical protein